MVFQIVKGSAADHMAVRLSLENISAVFQLGHFPRAQRPALIYMRPVPFVLRLVPFISALSFSSSLVQLPMGLNCVRQLNSSVLASHWLETIVPN